MKTLEPGRRLKIAGIDSVLTTDHNEVFYYWMKSGLRNAILLHIDAHADMADRFILESSLSENFYEKLAISAFICPAVHYGIISEVLWLNPHSDKRERRLQTFPIKGRLGTKIIDGKDGKKVCWDLSDAEKENLYEGIGRLVSHNNFCSEKPYILDIDLDAFCCDKYIPNVPCDYRGNTGFFGRIQETARFLSELRKPDLITITRSAGQPLKRQRDDIVYLKGKRYSERYVPQNMQEEVKRATILELRKAYKRAG